VELRGIDVFLGRHYQDKQLGFYLLDKTKTEPSVSYGFRPREDFYNSLDVAKATLIWNGIGERCVHLVVANDNDDIHIDNHVDIVISLHSWGFHFPVETNLEKVYDLLAEGGSVIMDIRRVTNGIDELKSVFGQVDLVCNEGKFQRVLASK